MNTYIEIVQKPHEKVVKRLDVTGKSERAVIKIEYGASINLNHEEFYTRTTKTPDKLPDV